MSPVILNWAHKIITVFEYFIFNIRPHNILVDPNSNKVVMCDFGSAKRLVKGEPNIAYICSRCYRAPELIFGATEYNA